MKQLELILLGLLVFVLPSLETPKTVFWTLYILLFLYRRYHEHGFTFTKPDGISLAVTGLFIVSLVSTLINWPLQKGFSGSFDTLSYAALFFCLYFGNYTSKQLRHLLVVAILGLLAGLLYGLVEFSSGITNALSLHSAGVTTQSSIYLGIVLIATLGLLADQTESPIVFDILLYLSLYLIGVALVYMGSRGAILAVIVCLAVLLVVNHSRRIVVITSTATIAATVTALLLTSAFPTNINKPEKRERFSVERFQKSDTERIENWKISLQKLSTGEDIFWGIGPKNYRSIDPRELGIESTYYQRTGKLSHAHNLFLTQLIEQGIIGLTVFFVFFFLICRRLFTGWHYCRDSNSQWVWISGMGALVVPVVAGFFNTPFYQEHAMLAMILIGILFNQTRNMA